MQIKIPKLKSRYIPVHNKHYAINDNVHWWKESSPFNYPNVLINLIGTTKKEIDSIKENSNDLFLLTDSGGFQVISGNCSLDWKHSLLKQIELGASKIFAFDIPPVKQKFEGSLNQFIYMCDKDTKNIIEQNINTALKQSEFLKEHHPDSFKRFCYIVHGKTKEQIDHNFIILNKKINGIDNYSDYFPGGVVYAAKNNDIMFIAMAARHAFDNFISKGKYVHFLGLGSFSRMLILIRNEITTFDSSSVLQGARANGFTNIIDISKEMQIPTSGYFLKGQFCICPVCSQVDYDELLKNNKPIGKFFISHNLWHLLKINCFLDKLDKTSYTDVVKNNFKVNTQVIKALEFIDECEKIGLEKAMLKFSVFFKDYADTKTQSSIFNF